MLTRTPMKKAQLGSRDLLANGGGCPVEVSHQYFYNGYYNLFLQRSFVVYDHQKIIVMSNSQIIHHHVLKLPVQLNLFSIHPRSANLSLHFID
jgi:hypothetical protein